MQDEILWLSYKKHLSPQKYQVIFQGESVKATQMGSWQSAFRYDHGKMNYVGKIYWSPPLSARVLFWDMETNTLSWLYYFA